MYAVHKHLEAESRVRRLAETIVVDTPSGPMIINRRGLMAELAMTSVTSVYGTPGLLGSQMSGAPLARGLLGQFCR